MSKNLATVAQINHFLKDNLHRMENPEIYLGGEPNAPRYTPEEWDNATFRTALTAVFDYKQGMGNLGLPTLLQLLYDHNHTTQISERIYWMRNQREVDLMDRAGIPPFGLETRHSMAAFDLIAFTCSYPAYWVNSAKLLKMAGIPTRWRDRMWKEGKRNQEDYPLVMVGGHIYATPFAVFPTADIIFCGEAEDETLEQQEHARATRDPKAFGAAYDLARENPGFCAVVDAMDAYKAKGMFYGEGREEMLYELACKYHFLLVPRFYEFCHEWVPLPDGQGEPHSVEDSWAAWRKTEDKSAVGIR
jgi:hypothetical protein